MILISSIYNDVALDNVNSAENGSLSFQMFNRLSRRGELRLLDFVTGGINNDVEMMPFTIQKDLDYTSQFIKKFTGQVADGKITRPEDYYLYQNLYLLGDYAQGIECGEDDEIVNDGCNQPVELLEGSKFYMRCNTFIEGLQPSFTKPIVKQVGKDFEFLPRDIGSVSLEYVRYPMFGKIVPKMDTIHNDEIIDEALSTNYEWEEYARELLVYFITDTFAIHTREKALKEQNIITQKLVRK